MIYAIRVEYILQRNAALIIDQQGVSYHSGLPFWIGWGKAHTKDWKADWPDIQAIHILPHLKKEDSAANRITFSELANDIEDVYSDPFSLRFAKSLRLWSGD